MTNVSTWSTTAASNNSAVPDGWPENMAPSEINDSGREHMAAIARWWAQIDGSLSSTGSSDAYVITTGQSHASLGVIGPIVFKANFTNASAGPTLAVDGLAAKTMKVAGTNVKAGDIISGGTYIAIYNATNDDFEIIGAPQVKEIRANFTESYSRAHYYTPATVTSTSNAVAIDMQTDQYCKHTLTENTTVAAPSNAAEGMEFSLHAIQDASSAYTLSWNSVFKGSIPAMSTTLSSNLKFHFYCYDGTNFAFMGATEAI